MSLKVFSADITLLTEPKVFIEMMDDAAEIDSRFRFKHTMYLHIKYTTATVNVMLNNNVNREYCLL